MASVKKNYLYNLISQMLTILLPVVTMPYITRVLGNGNLGIFNYAQSIVNYFILFGCIGLNDYSQREIAACKGDRHKQSVVFREVLLVRLVTVSLSAAIYFAGIVQTVDYPLYYSIFGLELLAALLDISWFHQGNENFRSQAIRTIATRFLGLVCIFLFVKTEADLYAYILCCSGAILAGNLSLWLMLKNELEPVPLKELRPWRHIRGCLTMFLPQIAINVYTQLDKTMLGLLTDHDYDQVGYYSQAEKIVKLAMTVVTSLGTIMLSRITIALNKESMDAVKEYIHKSMRFVCLLAWPITVGLAVAAEDMVPWFFGEGYEPVVPCMVALSPLVVIIGVGCVFGRHYMVPARRMKEFTATVVLGMTVNMLLNVLLIPYFGAMGAVAATLVAELTVSLSQYLLVRKLFPPRIFLAGGKNMLAALAMGAGVWLLASFLPPTIWATALEVGTGVVLYFGLLLLLRDEFLLENLKRGNRKD